MDNRGGAENRGKIVSRVGKWIPAKEIPTQITDELMKSILLETQPFDIVAFDESQFFSKEIMTLVKELAYNKKHVIIDGLNMNYKGKEFGYIGGLLAQADEIVRLFSWCACCGSPTASFSQLLINGKPAQNAPIHTIEGSASNIKYEPRCRNCFVPPEKA